MSRDVEDYKKMLAALEAQGTLSPFAASMKARIQIGADLSPKMRAALDRMMEQQTVSKIAKDPTFRNKLRVRFLVAMKMQMNPNSSEFLASLYRQFDQTGNLTEKQIDSLTKLLKKHSGQLEEMRSSSKISKDEAIEIYDLLASIPADEVDEDHKLQIEIICPGHPSEWRAGPWTDEVEEDLRALARKRISANPEWVEKAQESFELEDNIVRPFRSSLEMHCREVLRSGKVKNWFYYLRASDVKGKNSELFFYKK